MKVIALTALLGVASSLRLTGDDVYELKGGWQRHLNGDPDFE